MSASQRSMTDRPLRILLVSADPDDRQRVLQAMQPEMPGLTVRQVCGEHDLDLASADFDMAIIESHLPWTDSVSVVHAIRTRFLHLPVIIIADASSTESVLAALSSGIDSYIVRVSSHLIGLPTAIEIARDRSRERQTMRAASLALRESEEGFRTIVEQSPLSIQVMTPDGWIVQVNRAWEKLWGVTSADVQYYNVLHDQQARSLGMMPYVERGFAGEAVTMPPVAYHTPESLKLGRKRWFQAHIYPVKGERGEIRHVIMMYEDITERQWATEDLQKLSADLMNAQEAERKHISQELHDELGQSLTAIRINLASLERDLATNLAPANRERLAETSMLADQMLQHIRELSHDLRPTMLDELGLLPTLRWYVNRFAHRLGLEVEFETFGLEDRLAAEIETVLYRIIQEALTNVSRHAQARRLCLHLERSLLRVIVIIEDDGVGFDVQRWSAAAAPGLGAGLFGMRERVTLRGGVFAVHSQPGQGTRIFIELPLTPPSVEKEE